MQIHSFGVLRRRVAFTFCSCLHINAQIQGLQTNLLQAQSDLAVQIASDLQPDTYSTCSRKKETSSSLVSIVK